MDDPGTTIVSTLDAGPPKVVPHRSRSAPGWRWIHTPGHAPGHVSFFRDADRVLIAGDAFVTTKQESLLAALLKPQVVHGPPAYFNTDWSEAEASVRRLGTIVSRNGGDRPRRTDAWPGDVPSARRALEPLQ